MVVIAHNGVGVNASGKNLTQFQNALLDPRLSVLKEFFQIVIKPAEPRAPHTSGYAVN